MAWFIPALVAGLKALGLGAAGAGGAAAGRKIIGTGQPEARPTMAGAMRSGGAPKTASQHPIFPVPTQPMRVITLGELLGVRPAALPAQSSSPMSMLSLLGGR